jgi:hypothetical protein
MHGIVGTPAPDGQANNTNAAVPPEKTGTGIRFCIQSITGPKQLAARFFVSRPCRCSARRGNTGTNPSAHFLFLNIETGAWNHGNF